MDVHRVTSGGFAKGQITFQGLGPASKGKQLVVDFQNENLVARIDGLVVASVPDLICCLESDGEN